MSKRELAKINQCKNDATTEKTVQTQKIPYLKIFTDKRVLSVWFACFGSFTESKYCFKDSISGVQSVGLIFIGFN